MVLDVLKPHQPSIVDMSKFLGELHGVKSVNTVLREVDADTETVVLCVVGDSLDYEAVLDVIEQCGASVHSVDEVSVERSKRMA
jgi:hypothetical protein